jgi:hypothetical protein
MRVARDSHESLSHPYSYTPRIPLAGSGRTYSSRSQILSAGANIDDSSAA